MLTTRYKRLLNQFLEPVAAAVAATGVHPSAITIASLVLSSLVCLIFVRTQAVGPFCAAILVVGSLDGLDGAVARVSGKVTPFGGYLDAMCDRYVETIVALAVASVTGYWLLTMVVLAGSLLVSYAKARAAMEIPVSNQEWPDLMERTERDVLFILGLAAGAFFPWQPLGKDLFWWTLVVLSVLVHLTVVQRMLRARRYIRERAGESVAHRL